MGKKLSEVENELQEVLKILDRKSDLVVLDRIQILVKLQAIVNTIQAESKTLTAGEKEEIQKLLATFEKQASRKLEETKEKIEADKKENAEEALELTKLEENLIKATYQKIAQIKKPQPMTKKKPKSSSASRQDWKKT